MGKVLLDITMSLDGCIAQPDDGVGPIHDWFFTGDTVNPHNPFFKTAGRSTEVLDETLRTTGAIVAGRRTYDIVDGWGGNHPLQGVPVFVVTHAAPENVPQGSTPFVFVTDGVASAVRQARAAAGDRQVIVMGGADVVVQCLKAGLLDELLIHLAPVLLGEGMRLFDQLGAQRIMLEQIGVVEAPGVAHMRYRVVT